MKKIIQDSEGKKMIMNVISSMPSLPEGWLDLGLADDLPTDVAEIETASALGASKAADREFLRSTDWKVLRHIRQVALGETPTLSASEYLALEQLRSEAAARI